MAMGVPTDAELVRRARAGSGDAAGELFERHWPGAWRAARVVTGSRAMADDVAQDAFERAFAALGRFDRRRPFGPWLHRIVVNRAIDWARARTLRAEISDDGTIERAAARTRAEASDAEALASGLAALSPEHRAVIVLRHLLDYTPGEIAELLELPRGTVNSRLRRGLDALREAIGEELR